MSLGGRGDHGRQEPGSRAAEAAHRPGQRHSRRDPPVGAEHGSAHRRHARLPFPAAGRPAPAADGPQLFPTAAFSLSGPALVIGRDIPPTAGSRTGSLVHCEEDLPRAHPGREAAYGRADAWHDGSEARSSTRRRRRTAGTVFPTLHGNSRALSPLVAATAVRGADGDVAELDAPGRPHAQGVRRTPVPGRYPPAPSSARIRP